MENYTYLCGTETQKQFKIMTQAEFNKMYKRTIQMWEGAYFEKLEKISNDAQAMRKVFDKVKIVSYLYALSYGDALVSLIHEGKF